MQQYDVVVITKNNRINVQRVGSEVMPFKLGINNMNGFSKFLKTLFRGSLKTTSDTDPYARAFYRAATRQDVVHLAGNEIEVHIKEAIIPVSNTALSFNKKLFVSYMGELAHEFNPLFNDVRCDDATKIKW